MLNYKKIRPELMKKYEKQETVNFYQKSEEAYVSLYKFGIVRLPDMENPYSKENWEPEPGMVYLEANLAEMKRAKPVNRFSAGPDDMYRMVRSDDKAVEAWFPEKIFGVLEKKEGYDYYLDPKEKILWITSEPLHIVEIIASPCYMPGESE